MSSCHVSILGSHLSAPHNEQDCATLSELSIDTSQLDTLNEVYSSTHSFCRCGASGLFIMAFLVTYTLYRAV
jgi:hypothetical protein